MESNSLANQQAFGNLCVYRSPPLLSSTTPVAAPKTSMRKSSLSHLPPSLPSLLSIPSVPLTTPRQIYSSLTLCPLLLAPSSVSSWRAHTPSSFVPHIRQDAGRRGWRLFWRPNVITTQIPHRSNVDVILRHFFAHHDHSYSKFNVLPLPMDMTLETQQSHDGNNQHQYPCEQGSRTSGSGICTIGERTMSGSLGVWALVAGFCFTLKTKIMLVSLST